MPDRDILRTKGIRRQLGKFVRVIACIVANDYTVRCDSGMFVPDILGQTLGCLNNGQGIHARKSCSHPATQTGCAELDAYDLPLETNNTGFRTITTHTLEETLLKFCHCASIPKLLDFGSSCLILQNVNQRSF